MERGDHAQLVAAGGAYARLWRIQSELEEQLADDLLQRAPEGARPDPADPRGARP